MGDFAERILEGFADLSVVELITGTLGFSGLLDNYVVNS